MTFVLSALTQHEVIQVSDRRFTYTQPARETTYDDEKNKAVLFCGRLLFSFTGIGDLGLERQTDLWLAGRICDVITHTADGDQGVLLEGLATHATNLFTKLRYRGRRHAFVAVGWARFKPPAPQAPSQPHEFSPYVALLSNFHEGGRELPRARSEFSTWCRVLQPDEGGFVFDVPNHLSRADMDRLTGELAAADRARDPETLVNAMGSQIRAVAEREEGVGEGLMINRLPRSIVGGPPGMMAIASGPLPDAQTFLYVPPSGDTSIQLGPVATCGDVITSGFRAEPLPADYVPPRPGPTLSDDPPGLVRRWYLVPVVGTGSDADPYRAETLGRGGSAVLPSRADGHPKHGVALVLVSTEDHSPLEAHPQIYPVGELTDLDRPVDELDDAKRAWIADVTKLRRVPPHGLVGDVVRRLGKQLDEGFDESSFWVK